MTTQMDYQGCNSAQPEAFGEFPPVGDKNWEISARSLVAADDLASLACWLAPQVMPEDDLPAFDYGSAPSLTPAAQAVADLCKQDADSTLAELRQTIRWAVWAHTNAEYGKAAADYEASFCAAWPSRIMEEIWGRTPTEEAVATLRVETDRLLKAIRHFEVSTSEVCGYATATMAAAVARYYGSNYVLETKWHADIERMARTEHALAEELGVEEVNHLYSAVLDARFEAEAVAQINKEAV